MTTHTLSYKACKGHAVKSTLVESTLQNVKSLNHIQLLILIDVFRKLHIRLHSSIENQKGKRSLYSSMELTTVTLWPIELQRIYSYPYDLAGLLQ